MNREGTITWLRERRRKYVKRYGKRALRKVDHYFARQSLAPNTPVFETSLFPWVTDFEAHWRAIRAELDTLLQRRHDLPRFQDISPDQKRISPDDKWRAFVFYGFGYRSEQNCRLCPQTAQLLDRLPGVENAFFSILAPGKQIPSHHGVTKGLLRCHLGLIVPPAPERCFMEVGEVRCTWQEGRALIFDDTYPHLVSNETDQERAVLLFDFPRPMRSLGRMVRQVEFWLFRRSAYVRDAIRNEAQWEARVREMWT
jgi:aspartyl/asparaginyl beta-hydroxylase (cupin superfamily)